MIRALLPTACAVLVLSGCAAGERATGTTTTPQPPAGPAADAVDLPGLLVSHGPAGFTLPRQTSVTSRIDQPNVVTLTIPTSQGREVAGWLTTRLPSGWVVDARRGESVLFHGPEWQGAHTCSQTTCALTLRHQSS